MKQQQETKIQALAVALNVDTAKLANENLVQGLEAILKQAYENNKKIYTNQVKLAVTNHPNQLPAPVLAQLKKELNQRIASATPGKTAEQTNTHTSTPRRTR